MVKRLQSLFGGEPSRARRFELPGDPLPVLFGLAQSRPRPSGNRLAGQAQRTAVGGELVQERIGGGVVRLP